MREASENAFFDSEARIENISCEGWEKREVLRLTGGSACREIEVALDILSVGIRKALPGGETEASATRAGSNDSRTSRGC